MPSAGDVRNDLYITLVSGEFQRDQKKTHKNIEAEVCVVSQSGQLVQVRFSAEGLLIVLGNVRLVEVHDNF